MERVKATTGLLKVLGDGMVEKAVHVKQGDLVQQGDLARSQSPHSSDETP